jgi:hypothetical protein
MHGVDVSHGLRGRVYLKELCGRQELDVSATDPATTTGWSAELLRQTIVDVPGAIGPNEVMDLPLGVRDQLLLCLYEQTFGPRIQSTVQCAACHEHVELGLDTAELLAHVLREANETTAPTADDIEGFRLKDGTRFRVPTLGDQLAVAALPARAAVRELVARTLIDAPDDELDEVALARLQDAMTAVAPLVELDIELVCSECRHGQTLHFEIGEHLAASLLREREVLLREIHLLASAYGWSLDAILSLPRRQRHRLVSFVQHDRAGGR